MKKKENSKQESELLAYIGGFPELTWFIAMGAVEFVSRPVLGAFLNKIDVKNLMELRVFGEDREIKAVRGALGEEFQIRDSADYDDTAAYPDIKSAPAFHYLDIDRQASGESSAGTGFVTVQATGGGPYGIPEGRPVKIELLNYFRPDKKTGFWLPFDFRIVAFCSKEGTRCHL